MQRFFCELKLTHCLGRKLSCQFLLADMLFIISHNKRDLKEQNLVGGRELHNNVSNPTGHSCKFIYNLLYKCFGLGVVFGRDCKATCVLKTSIKISQSIKLRRGPWWFSNWLWNLMLRFKLRKNNIFNWKKYTEHLVFLLKDLRREH